MMLFTVYLFSLALVQTYVAKAAVRGPDPVVVAHESLITPAPIVYDVDELHREWPTSDAVPIGGQCKPKAPSISHEDYGLTIRTLPSISRWRDTLYRADQFPGKCASLVGEVEMELPYSTVQGLIERKILPTVTAGSAQTNPAPPPARAPPLRSGCARRAFALIQRADALPRRAAAHARQEYP
ncbi:hypothetical protein NMY22_g10218 [Coprinellus aureogranulatus]|nr:hypothetical protein NMY22_g10218 [Coprinellus aureogranulatus]